MRGPLRRVGIGFGRMEIWHDGLGEFSKQIGQHLAVRADQLRQEHGIALSFHLAERWHGFFGDQVAYLPLRDHQRWVHLTSERFDLWHTLHQHNRFKPPLGARQKIMTVHDLNFLYFKHPSKAAKYLRRTQRILNRQTSVVTISQYVCDDLERHLQLKSMPTVIYNGATDLTLAEREAPHAVDSGFLLHISRMAASKNIRSLLDLAVVMPRQKFVFAGPRSPDSEAVAHEIKIRGLTNIQLLESVSEAQKTWLYANCCGFLFPSLTEGFGLPPLEAMYFGKPVFLSRLTSLPEVGGAVAHYFDRFEPASMHAVVDAGLAAHAVSGQAEAIMEHARYFSWARCADAYVQLYLDLLDMSERFH